MKSHEVLNCTNRLSYVQVVSYFFKTLEMYSWVANRRGDTFIIFQSSGAYQNSPCWWFSRKTCLIMIFLLLPRFFNTFHTKCLFDPYLLNIAGQYLFIDIINDSSATRGGAYDMVVFAICNFFGSYFSNLNIWYFSHQMVMIKYNFWYIFDMVFITALR